jgi:hypothetical protein
MTRTSRIIIVATAFGALFAAASSQAHAWQLRQWKVDFAGSPSANSSFALSNTETGKQMRYGERDYGINLVWDGGSTREWRLERANGSAGALRWDEPLALRNTTINRYVRYQVRDYGINLGWTTTRETQWRVRGGTAGTTIPAGYLVSIYNTVEPDYLVHGARAFGINLCWAGDFHPTNYYTGWNC